MPVVSGLALGIDATAHRGCLDGGGAAFAVLACGPDVAYPRRHRRLHERIRENGLVLSELPPGTPPFRWSFPARNRIMAALSRLTVVVEAADPSGSLITADFARDLGRSVAAVPGRVTSKVARGTNGLLKDGAVPITSTEDVLDELFGVGARHPPAPSHSVREPEDPGLRHVLAVGRATGFGGFDRQGRRPLDGPDAGRARPPGSRWLPGAPQPRWLGAGARPYPRGPVSHTSSLPPKVLSIAGSDSGGGAGIQADLKAFARCGVHGMTAITAVTAQNTVAVTGVYPLPPEAIVEQVRAVVEDIGVDAVKIGMLGTAETIAAVDRALDLVGDAPIVLDPVMVAESGARLLDEDAEEVLRTRLLRRVAVVTPNLPEARVLAGAEETARARRRGRDTGRARRR